MEGRRADVSPPHGPHGRARPLVWREAHEHLPGGRDGRRAAERGDVHERAVALCAHHPPRSPHLRGVRGQAPHLLLRRCRRAQHPWPLRGGHLAHHHGHHGAQARRLRALQPDRARARGCRAQGGRGRRGRGCARRRRRVRPTLPKAHQAGQAPQDGRAAAAHELLHGALPLGLPHPTGHPRLPARRRRGRPRARPRRGGVEKRAAPHHRQPLPAPLRRQVRARLLRARGRQDPREQARGGPRRLCRGAREAPGHARGAAAGREGPSRGRRGWWPGGPCVRVLPHARRRRRDHHRAHGRAGRRGAPRHPGVPHPVGRHRRRRRALPRVGRKGRAQQRGDRRGRAQGRGLHRRGGVRGRLGAGPRGPRVRCRARRARVPRGRQGRSRPHGPGRRDRHRGRGQHRHGRGARGQAPARREERAYRLPSYQALYARRRGGAGRGARRRRGALRAARAQGRRGRRAHLRAHGAGRARRERPPLATRHRRARGAARNCGDMRRGRAHRGRRVRERRRGARPQGPSRGLRHGRGGRVGRR